MRRAPNWFFGSNSLGACQQFCLFHGSAVIFSFINCSDGFIFFVSGYNCDLFHILMGEGLRQRLTVSNCTDLFGLLQNLFIALLMHERGDGVIWIELDSPWEGAILNRLQHFFVSAFKKLSIEISALLLFVLLLFAPQLSALLHFAPPLSALLVFALLVFALLVFALLLFAPLFSKETLNGLMGVVREERKGLVSTVKPLDGFFLNA